MTDRTEYRAITEQPVPNDSRVYRTERPIATEEAALELARVWSDPLRPDSSIKGWVEMRRVTDWEVIDVG